MGELLAKLTTYNLFNYLFPGAVFVFAVRSIDIVPLASENIIVDLFLFYFAGLTISRIGSVIVEPVLKKLQIVVYADYAEFIKASKDDKKIDELLEVNNVYRTIIALFLCLALAYAAAHAVHAAYVSAELMVIIACVLMLVLYVFSFRKQTSYIRKRIERNQASNEVDT